MGGESWMGKFLWKVRGVGVLKKFRKLIEDLMNKSGKETITIVVLIGVLLLVISLPTKKSSNDENSNLSSGTSSSSYSKDSSDVNSDNVSSDSAKSYEEYLEDKISVLLSKADGVGKAQVVVSVKNTSEKIIAKDVISSEESVNETDSAGGVRSSQKSQNSSTNISANTNNGDEPFVTMENMPEIEGVVVVAQGGGEPTVVSEITSAIEALLGVPAHKIKVLKMS